MQTTSMKPRVALASAFWRAAKRFLNPAPTSEQLRAMRHLERLDDHLLADLGLGRSGIAHAVLTGTTSNH